MDLPDSCTLQQQDNIQIISIDNHLASAKLALFGAHMLSFVPKHDQRERLWLSQAAIFDGQHAIRGGIPICWPWFGDHPAKHSSADAQNLPAHGYVRTQSWTVVSATDSEAGTHLVLQPANATGPGFAQQVELTLSIDIGKQLVLRLTTRNTGQHAFNYNAALHSYFEIGNIHECQLHGLSGQYLDKTLGMQAATTPQHYTFNQETDRVHLCQAEHVYINAAGQRIDISSQGHDSVVVWNPWQAKSISMKDMPDTGYLSMLCVESAVTQNYTVAPGSSHSLQQIIC